MPSTASATPPVNVYEANGQLSIATPIPGAHAEHVALVVTPDRLELEADCKYAQDEQHYLRRDWQVGSWRLEVDLPARIDPRGARAKLRHGVLVVVAPRSDEGVGEARPSVE